MAGPSDGDESPTVGLLHELAAILSALILGVLAVRLRLVRPERGDMAAIGLITGNIGLPLLVFRTLATARLEGLDLGVALACGLGKGLMMAIVWGITYFAYKPPTQSKKERFLTASVFSLVAVLTNDFALGFPVIEALYGHEMTAYIATNAVVGSAFFTPLGSVLLAVGSSLPDDSGNGNQDAEKTQPLQQHGDVGNSTSHKCADFMWFLRIVRGALMNSIVLSAILGLFFKLFFSRTLTDDGHTLGLPCVLGRVVSLFTSPFGMCSLFMTGTNVRSVKISIWPLFLVVSKVVVVAFVSFQLSTMMVQRDAMYTDKTNFSFFYGTIPTSAAPIILGSKFAPGSTELVATSILMAVFLAGIIMYMFAVNAMTPSHVSMNPELAALQKYFSIMSVASMAVVVPGVLVLSLKGSWGWSRPGKQMLAALGASIAVYESAMLVFNQLVLDGGDSLCGDWSALLMVIAFFQNCSRLLVLGFPVLIMKWGPRRLCAEDTAGYTGLMLMALALVGSGVLCRLVYPNAVAEVCGAAAEATGQDPGKVMADVRIWPIHLVDQLLFWAMLGLLIAIAWRRRGRWSGQQPSEGKGAKAEEVAEPRGSDAKGDDLAEETDMLEEWFKTPPRGLFKIIILAQAVRTLQQMINSSQVLTSTMINGGFVTMLILEYFLEHGQGFLLLVAFALDTNFMNAIAQAITSTLPSLSQCAPITRGDASTPIHPSTYSFGATCEFAAGNQQSVAIEMCKSESGRSLRRRSTLGSKGPRMASEFGGSEDNTCPMGSGLGANLYKE